MSFLCTKARNGLYMVLVPGIQDGGRDVDEFIYSPCIDL